MKDSKFGIRKTFKVILKLFVTLNYFYKFIALISYNPVNHELYQL